MERIWWEQVPNARLFIDKFSDILIKQESIVLHHSSPLPWYYAFVSTVQDAVRQQTASKAFVALDGTEDPGSTILKAFCSQAVRAQFRPGRRCAAFLAETNGTVLHERFILVKIPSDKQLGVWMDFVSEYLQNRKSGLDKAVFILDWQGAEPTSRRRKLEMLSYDGFVGEYDHLIFAMMTAASIPNIGSLKKNYLAELLVHVLGKDIELYVQCLNRYNDFLKNPFETVMSICEGEQPCVRGTGEPFSFSKTREEADHSVWKTQIKTLYHVLEENRVHFIHKHRVEVALHLPKLDQVYKDPDDVELGKLKWLAEKDMIALNDIEKQKIKAFSEARNKLSHLKILSFDEVDHLIS